MKRIKQNTITTMPTITDFESAGVSII